MEVIQYLKHCLENNDMQEALLTWHFAGAEKCNNDTKFYKKGSAYLVDCSDSIFHNYIVYCHENYTGQVQWQDIKSLNEARQTTLADGLTAECFTFSEKKLENVALVESAVLLAGTSYVPFTKYSAESSSNTDIIIDDDTYFQILKVIGVPFVRESELEYNRQAILKLAVEPALRLYYTHFPITQEQVIKGLSVGDFMIPYPTEPYPAYDVVTWKTSPGPMQGSMAVNGMSPLAGLGTDIGLYTRAAAGNTFAQGIRYNKAVPGYTGEGTSGGTSAFSELATAWPIANTMRNVMAREKLSKVRVPGQGLFAKGYSTKSGILNLLWLCWSRNFDDVDFADWTKVVQLCQAHVKATIGPIRELLRTDSNIPFKDGITKEGLDEISAIEKEWMESPYNKIYTTMRGSMI